MAIIYADQVSELAIEATIAGKPHVNVLHYVNDESAQSDAVKARDILDNWQDHMLDLVENSYSLVGATWRSLDRDDRNQGSLAPNSAKPVTGSGSAGMLPPNVSYLIKKVTQNRERGQRDGRIFLGGVPVGILNEDGTIGGAFVTQFQGYLDSFTSGVNDNAFGVGGGSGLVVLNTTPASRMKGTNEVDLTWRPVSSLVIDPKISTQRDRLR